MIRWILHRLGPLTLTQAFAMSGFVHACVGGMLLGWGITAWDEAPRFAGTPLVVYAQWSAAASSEVPPPVELDATPVAAEVLITPQTAEVEQRRLIDTATNDVSTAEQLAVAEIVVPDGELPLRPDVARSVPPDPAPPQPTPTAEPLRLERRPARPPAPASAAAAAVIPNQSLGTDESSPPTFAGNRPPSYPDQARRMGWQGTVLLELAIDETGQVVEVRVLESSGHSVLDGAAVMAVRQWKGQPARRGGQPVATRERLPVRFRLP